MSHQVISMSARRRQAGATFAELMLAVLIISTTVVASTSSMRGTTEVYHYFADGAHEALMLGQEIHEAALLLPWSEADATGASFGPDVELLWDLDGKSYSPPRSADYDIVTSHLGWSQTIEVNTVDFHNPSVEVDPESFAGETITELKVLLMNGTAEVATYSWWMSEPSHD